MPSWSASTGEWVATMLSEATLSGIQLMQVERVIIIHTAEEVDDAFRWCELFGFHVVRCGPSSEHAPKQLLIAERTVSRKVGHTNVKWSK